MFFPYDGLVLLILIFGGMFASGVYQLHYLRKLQRKGTRVVGRVVGCEPYESEFQATIEYAVNGYLHEVQSELTPMPWKLGEEVIVHYFPGCSSQGQIITGRIWFTTWATIVLSVLAPFIFFVVMPLMQSN